jgi:hypothetical protein
LQIYEIIKPCLKPDYLQLLANRSEIAYLKSQADDPLLLRDRKMLSEQISAELQRARTEFFKKHKKKLNAAAACLKISLQDTEEFLIKILSEQIEYFYLKKREEAVFWQPYIEALLFDIERKEEADPLSTLPSVLSHLVIQVYNMPKTSGFSVQETSPYCATQGNASAATLTEQRMKCIKKRLGVLNQEVQVPKAAGVVPSAPLILTAFQSSPTSPLAPAPSLSLPGDPVATPALGAGMNL